MNIFLYNTCSSTSCSWINNDLFNFIKVFGHLDAMSTVCVFTWFDNPNVSVWQWRSISFWLFINLISCLLIWATTWRVDNFFVVIILSLLLFGSFLLLLLDKFLVLDPVFTHIIILLKLLEFWITNSSLDVEGYR